MVKKKIFEMTYNKKEQKNIKKIDLTNTFCPLGLKRLQIEKLYT